MKEGDFYSGNTFAIAEQTVFVPTGMELASESEEKGARRAGFTKETHQVHRMLSAAYG